MKTFSPIILLFLAISVSAETVTESLKKKISTNFNVELNALTVSKLNNSNYFKVIINEKVLLSDGENIIDGRVISIDSKSDLLAVAQAELEAERLLSNANKKVTLSSVENTSNTINGSGLEKKYRLVNEGGSKNVNKESGLVRQQVAEFSQNPTNAPFPKETVSKEAILRDISKRITHTLPDESTIVFPAKGPVKDTVTIITDPKCVYCQRLHKDIGFLNEQGYTVRYILFPTPKRSGKKFVPNPTSIVNIQAALCSTDPQGSANRLFEKQGNYKAPFDMETCDFDNKNAVDLFNMSKYAYAAQGGTPVIMSKNGFISSLGNSKPGYETLTKLVSHLQKIEPKELAAIQ